MRKRCFKISTVRHNRTCQIRQILFCEKRKRNFTQLFGEALDLVNQVRLRAYNNDASGKISDSDFTLDFILDERARELYLESIRRTDLVRFNKFTSDSYIWQWKGGVLDGRSVNDKYNIYPIPDTDLTANPNLSNPLY